MQTLEEYIKKHEHEDGFRYFLDRIVREENMKTFEQIIQINPYYRVIDFDEDFFAKDFVQEYGVETLLKLQSRIDEETLRLGLRDKRLKEKIIYFADFKPAFDIKKSHVMCLDFSIELLEKFKKKFDSFELICFARMFCFAEDDEMEEVLPLLDDKESLFKIRYMMTHTQEFFFTHITDNMDFFTSKEGTIFVKALISSNFDQLLYSNELLRIFKQYKHLFTDERIIEAKTLSAFIKEPNKSEYTMETPEDLIFFLKRKSARAKFLTEEKRVESIFGISKEKLEAKIRNYLETNKTNKFLTADDIIRLLNLELTLDSKAFIDMIEKKYRAVCKRDIASSLFIPQGTGTIDITDKDFRAIFHQVRFNGPNSAGRKFMIDPTTWNKGEIEGAYLSGTLATQYSFGTIGQTKDYIIGLSEIESDDIVDMGLEDIFSTIYYYYNNLTNPLSDFRTHEDFERSTGCVYNEVTLRRFRNGVSLKPNFTLAFDKISEFNRLMQEFFNIPIFYIDSMKSASRMNAHNDELLCRNKLREFGIYLYRFYVSFMYNPEIVERFFDRSILENTLNLLIKNYHVFKVQEDKEAILFIIDIIHKINQGLLYTDPCAELVDVEEFRKKLI